MGCGGSKKRDTDSDNEYDGDEEQQGLVAKENREQEEVVPAAVDEGAANDEKQPNGALQQEEDAGKESATKTEADVAAATAAVEDVKLEVKTEGTADCDKKGM